MKTLVIGGSGYVGGHVAERLRVRGFDVTVFARGRTRARMPDGIGFIKGDRHDREELRSAARMGFDAVVDVCAHRREDTQAAVDAFDGRAARFVHISTLAANRLTSGFPLRESDPLVSDPHAGRGYEMAECERALHQAHAKSDFPFVSIRPPVVFGPRDRVSRENYYLKRILAGDAVILPDGGLLPVLGVFVRDLADAVAGAIVSETSAGRAYHVVMRERVSVREHVENLARAVGKPVETISVPARVLERAGFTLAWFPYYAGERLVDLDTAAAERDLDFRPTPYARALEATATYFVENGPESLPSIEDRHPPVMPRARQTRFARAYAEKAAAFEAAFARDSGDLMEGFR